MNYSKDKLNKWDVLVSLSSGILTSMIDVFMIDDISLLEAHEWGKKEIDDFVIKVARSKKYNSASSQFFICHADCSDDLDGLYAAFGKVIAGMDVVDRIASVPTNFNDKPVRDQKMTSVRIIDEATALAAVAAEAAGTADEK